MIIGTCRKVLYKFPDGQQMAEEYSMDTGLVSRRAWRRCKQLVVEPAWEIEVGDASAAEDDFVMKESNTAPAMSQRVTEKNLEWRIRNLPYPMEVYQVQADAEKNAIVVKTTNRKYYKVISVPELARCGLKPEQANIAIQHQYNTLFISYRKPELLCEMEAQVLLLLKVVLLSSNINLRIFQMECEFKINVLRKVDKIFAKC